MTEQPKLALTCQRCTHKWSIDLPEPEFSNNFKSSAVIVAHPTPIRCANNKCRAAYVLIVQGASLVFNATPVDDAKALEIEGTRIIKPKLEIVGGIS